METWQFPTIFNDTADTFDGMLYQNQTCMHIYSKCCTIYPRYQLQALASCIQVQAEQFQQTSFLIIKKKQAAPDFKSRNLWRKSAKVKGKRQLAASLSMKAAKSHQLNHVTLKLICQTQTVVAIGYTDTITFS